MPTEDAVPISNDANSDPGPRPKPPFPTKLAYRLFAASVFATVLVFPYSYSIMKQSHSPIISDEPGGWMGELASSVGGEGILSMLMIWLGLRAGARIGLGTTVLAGFDDGTNDRARARNSLLLAVALGMLLGAAFLALSPISQPYLPKALADVKSPPLWQAFLASIGAGIREEIWCRLGLMTILAGLVSLPRGHASASPVVIWTANVLAALGFGAMHLPQAAQFVGLSLPIVVYALAGNGIPGIVFGWLYWRRGLVSAMVAHATIDVVLKVIVPLLGWSEP